MQDSSPDSPTKRVFRAIPANPYIIDVPSERPYPIRPDQNAYEYCRMPGATFRTRQDDTNELHLQHMSFLNRDVGGTLLTQHASKSQEDAGIETRPVKRLKMDEGAGGGTPGTPTVKKKISLQDYKKKSTARSTPVAASTPPPSNGELVPSPAPSSLSNKTDVADAEREALVQRLKGLSPSILLRQGAAAMPSMRDWPLPMPCAVQAPKPEKPDKANTKISSQQSRRSSKLEKAADVGKPAKPDRSDKPDKSDKLDKSDKQDTHKKLEEVHNREDSNDVARVEDAKKPEKAVKVEKGDRPKAKKSLSDRLQETGKLLKRRYEDLNKKAEATEDKPARTKLEKQLLLTAVESVVCFMRAFFERERNGEAAKRLWPTLYPMLKLVSHRARSTSDIAALMRLLDSAVSQRALLALGNVKWEDMPDEKTKKEHWDSVQRATSRLQAASVRNDGDLTWQKLQETFPKTLGEAGKATLGLTADMSSACRIAIALLEEWSAQENVEWKRTFAD